MNNFYVELNDSPLIYEALQKMAFKAGFRWPGNSEKVDIAPCIALYFCIHQYGYSNTLFRNINMSELPQWKGVYERFTIDEAIAFLKTPREQPIYIGDYEVKFLDTCIKVGCQQVSFEAVDKIYEQVQKIRNSK